MIIDKYNHKTLVEFLKKFDKEVCDKSDDAKLITILINTKTNDVHIITSLSPEQRLSLFKALVVEELGLRKLGTSELEDLLRESKEFIVDYEKRHKGD